VKRVRHSVRPRRGKRQGLTQSVTTSVTGDPFGAAEPGGGSGVTRPEDASEVKRAEAERKDAEQKYERARELGMSLAELCVKRSVFAVMLIAFLVVLGIFSFRDLGVDLFPRADPATVNINVRLPGATPEEVTTQVVLPLEEALSPISGLDELTSTATEGSARVTYQFVLERVIESAAQDVREKVAGASWSQVTKAFARPRR